jgi:hypothetical protein
VPTCPPPLPASLDLERCPEIVVLEPAEDPRPALAEARETLPAGGTLVVAIRRPTPPQDGSASLVALLRAAEGFLLDDLRAQDEAFFVVLRRR